MFDTEDMAEAFTAAMEKRTAEFHDLWPLSDGLSQRLSPTRRGWSECQPAKDLAVGHDGVVWLQG